MAKKSITNQLKNIDTKNIKNALCDNKELSDKFISDFIIISGLEIDDDGYLINTEDDFINPEYIEIKGKLLRYTNKGVLHTTDMIFDPYNNIFIMEELFRNYIKTCHKDVISFQILNKNMNKKGINTLGYISIIYFNGAKVQTANHYKDTTKYLDAFMRMESYTNDLINEILAPYDLYESQIFENNETKGIEK